jgi:DnaK suppressor protein
VSRKQQSSKKSAIEKGRKLKQRESVDKADSPSPSSSSQPGCRHRSLRENLLNHKKRLLESSKRSLCQLLDGDKYKGISDDADLAALLYDDAIVAAQSTRSKERLKAVNAALQRLEEDTYGFCEECGEEIPAERLRIVPFAAYCTYCQDMMEKVALLKRDSEGGFRL